MELERWAHVKELFASALEREPGQRSLFLQQACGDDTALREEVESLLASHRTTDSSLGPLPSLEIESIADVKPASMVGRRLGAYRLISQVGCGGMATVYLAERCDELYRKRVAIKVVSAALDEEQMLRRFRQERHTLAAFDHPNIVKLLDAGNTEEGLPYLVMDYVEGLPIDEYCDSHRLSTDERLRLFLTVCVAVQYAHQNLVLHRDLKPGNILVSHDGNPKLLDFGIAKLLNPELYAGTIAATLTGLRLMTPEYASPEQVRGEPLTNATDIYSLGVILYELLTGLRPYELRSRTPSEIERVICDEEPVRPSEALSRARRTTEGEIITPETISRTRERDAITLCRRLRGDLDNIVLLALRKEPQRRYSSAYEFSEDIRAHLEHRSIKAHPSSAAYRAYKFLSRHKTQALTGSLLLAIVTFIALVLIYRSNPGWGHDVGGKVKSRPSVAVIGFENLSGRAEKNWLSTALSEMLTTELAAGEQLRAVPGESVARMKLDLKLPVAESLAPDTLKRVRYNLSTDYVVLGSYLDTAEDTGAPVRIDVRLQDAQSGQTLAMFSEKGPEGSLDQLVDRAGTSLRRRLGAGEIAADQVALVRAALPSEPEAARLYAEGLDRLRVFDAKSARALLEKAITVEPSYAQAHSALAQAWLRLGYEPRAQEEAKKAFDLSAGLSRADRLWIEGQYREIGSEWDKAVEIYKALFLLFPDNLEYGLRLATAQGKAGKAEESLETLRTLRQLPKAASDDPRIDLVELNAADDLGDFKREQAIASRAKQKAEARGSSLLMAQALYDEAYAYLNLGELTKAEASARQSRQIYEAAGDRSGAAKTLTTEASALKMQGQFSVAMQMMEQALAIQQSLGNRHAEAVTLNQMGNLLHSHGDFASAKDKYERCLAIMRANGERQNETKALNNIAGVLHDQGDLVGARKVYEQVLTLYRALGDRDGSGMALMNLANNLTEQGDLASAKKFYDESLEIFQTVGDKNSTADALSGLGDLLRTQAQLPEASQKYTESLRLRESIGEKGSVAESRLALAQLALDEARPAEAEALATDALQEFKAESLLDEQVSVQALRARALLAEGKALGAQKEIDAAEPLAAKSQKRSPHLDLGIARAQVLAALGKTTEACTMLNQIVDDAKRSGFMRYQLAASLALGEAEIRSGDRNQARQLLSQVVRQARAKQFLLIARKAEAATSH